MKALLLTALAVSLIGSAHARPKVVAYVPNWINLEEFAKTIDYSKVTHLKIAFENPTDDSGELSFNRRNKALLEMAKAAKVKVLVSIGGGSASSDAVLKDRYFKLLADDRRADFVKKIAAYLEKHGFDGLDVDIEGPSINEDYGDFIADLAAALKPKGKLLTAALSKGYGGDRVPDAALGHFDFLNIMAYDAKGSWNPDAPGQHSSLEFAKEAANYWLKRGLPKDKAILGVPFYGYGFGKDFRNGGFGYDDILARHPEAHEQDEVGETIWHNGQPTIRAKAKHVLAEGLGGVMIWSLDNDVKGDKSLLDALHSELVPAPKK
ncbi:glycosyl hydrolase family 18 protein [Luteolibacter flavescens]|uniref:chitinase n=1 Tax=Luteolibacter flavescens TaxID=1859460 RepID=A0ABT3FI76_9BACT|nr:glycosyl hydrolase family 18 protein [Luteolibacter flavescens]MCW1883257.1 glycosyl hydrolase family 18 protein [Luteolibacter flavescens]